jgi:hypothetical protein
MLLSNDDDEEEEEEDDDNDDDDDDEKEEEEEEEKEEEEDVLGLNPYDLIKIIQKRIQRFCIRFEYIALLLCLFQGNMLKIHMLFINSSPPPPSVKSRL